MAGVTLCSAGRACSPTPLFVGFPGLVAKLWLAADEQGVYRGLYEWDGAARAESYARALWRVLALVSVRGSVHYRVIPGLRREELLARSDLHAEPTAEAHGWWRPVAVGWAADLCSESAGLAPDSARRRREFRARVGEVVDGMSV